MAPTCVHLKCTARTVFPQHHSAVAVSAATVTISGESQTTRYTASYCPLRSTATVTAFQKCSIPACFCSTQGPLRWRWHKPLDPNWHLERRSRQHLHGPPSGTLQLQWMRLSFWNTGRSAKRLTMRVWCAYAADPGRSTWQPRLGHWQPGSRGCRLPRLGAVLRLSHATEQAPVASLTVSTTYLSQEGRASTASCCQ